MNQKKFYRAFTPAKVVIYHSMNSSYLIWRAFWRTSSNFPAFQTSLKFGFLVKQFVTFLISFSVWFFKTEFNSLSDLLNTWFTIIGIGLFYGGKHLGAKLWRFLTSRWRFLVGTKSGMTKCENTSNTGWVLLMFY